MNIDWPVQVYSADDAVEKAKLGRFPFKVSAPFAPTLMGIPPAENEDELRPFVEKAFSAAQVSNPDVTIEPV